MKKWKKTQPRKWQRKLKGQSKRKPNVENL